MAGEGYKKRVLSLGLLALAPFSPRARADGAARVSGAPGLGALVAGETIAGGMCKSCGFSE